MRDLRSQNIVSVRYDRGTLVLDGLADRELHGAFGDEPWQWDERIGAWRCDAVHYAAVREILSRSFGPRADDTVPSPPRMAWPKVDLPKLRPEQREALAAWRAGRMRGQVIMPTGTGKTMVALAAMAAARAATLVVAPVRDLMYQWHRQIEQHLGYDAGIVGDNLYNLQPVTVTTYDSAYIHAAELGSRFGMLIYDEEHHLAGASRREAAIMNTAPCRLGLTATPERADGKHADLAWLVGPEVYRMSIAAARGRTLAEFEVVRVPVALTDPEQAVYDQCTRQVRSFLALRRDAKKGYDWQDLCKESAADPAARSAQKAYRVKQAIEDRATEKLRVLEDLFRLHIGQKTIVFAGSNAMAMEVSRRFLAPTILSHTPKGERRTVLDGFADGSFPVLIANRVLDEGIDVPAAKIAIVLGGQASTRQAKQRLGRILRRQGNAPATLYEVVCENTKEVYRSRQRRASDAYERTRHRRI